MRFFSFNSNKELELIKTDVIEVKRQLTSLLESVERNNIADAEVCALIKKQDAAIDRLNVLNVDKEKKLTGLSRWVILGVLGVMSLSVQYSLAYDKGTGISVKPSSGSSPILPIAYGVAIIAIAANQDDKVGVLIDSIVKKISG
ncbi:MAG: hypothetical protein KME47_09990 [Nodosilinea sp. WJT8-NPBG4]|jgi:hypothetical protein|nr:hypothetical protein [Nodosilinea sp. WJT8-NPBG4]